MSSPVRLLLVSGSPGVDTGALGRAAVAEARAGGHAAVLVAMGEPSVADAYGSLWSDLAAGVGPILRDLGLGGIDADRLGWLPGIADLACAVAACEAAAIPEALVVWDVGTGDQALRALSSLTVAAVLLEQVLTPHTSARARQAGTGSVDAIVGLQDRILAAEAVLAESAVSWVVASTPEATSAARGTAAGLGLWQVPVDLIVQEGPELGQLPRDIPRERVPMHWVDGSEPDGYRLCIRLPHAQRDGLRVGRAGTSLVLAHAQIRRHLPLPPALQRCLVDGASLEDGLLVVRMQPDPAAWRGGDRRA